MTPPAGPAPARLEPGWLIAALAWATVIWLVSDRPRADLPLVLLFEGQDKIAHAVVYFTLAYLFGRGLGVRALRWLVILLVVAAWGALDELHQSVVPGRDASFADWIADVVGGVAAIAALRRRGESG